jgi:hypothetical protein
MTIIIILLFLILLCVMPRAAWQGIGYVILFVLVSFFLADHQSQLRSFIDNYSGLFGTLLVFGLLITCLAGGVIASLGDEKAEK